MNPDPPDHLSSARPPLIMGLIAMSVLIGGVGLWSVTAQISGAVLASGQVEVQQHRQVVQHPDGGVVQQILVREGQFVSQGDPLLTLDSSTAATELAIVDHQYYETLARRGRLESERADLDHPVFPQELLDQAGARPDIAALMSGQSDLFTARHDTLAQALGQLSQQSDQISAQILGIEAQTTALDRQRGLIQQELDSQRLLFDKGLAQSARVLSLEREAARLDGQMGEVIALHAQSLTRLSGVDIARLEKTAERRETAETQLRDLGNRQLELFERRKALREKLSRSEIRAPASGIVQDMRITTPRSVIRAAEPVLFIVPQDRPLLVSVRIQTIDIKHVQKGQQVLLRFPAFPSRSTPEIFGNLNLISADILHDEVTRTPYYRGEVVIPAKELSKIGQGSLVPGMPVEVFIQTKERSVITYLLKPFTDYFRRAFRES